MNNSDLKKLKKQLIENQKNEKLAKQKAAKEAQRQQVNDNRDDDLFRAAMSGVSPLSANQASNKAYHEDKASAVKPTAKKLQHHEQDELEIHDPLSDELYIEEVEPEGSLSFCRSGIQKSVFRKLRSGQYRISDELDLHGTTIKQAKQVLMYYLQETPQFESCCVRIIHGKGHRSGENKPVLKTHVNHWLSEHDRVLAFHSAKAKDGGTGAVYVLLKR